MYITHAGLRATHNVKIVMYLLYICMCICMCIHTYITHAELRATHNVKIVMYLLYICMCICMCIHIYKYVHKHMYSNTTIYGVCINNIWGMYIYILHILCIPIIYVHYRLVHQ